MNACAFRIPYLPTSKGSTVESVELVDGLWFILPTTGFESWRLEPTKYESLHLKQVATQPTNPGILFEGSQVPRTCWDIQHAIIKELTHEV